MPNDAIHQMSASRHETQQLLQKALELSDNGDTINAIKVLKEYVDNDNRLPEPLLLLIELKLKNKESGNSASLNEYKERLGRAEWQSDYRVLHQRGRCSQEIGKLSEAEKFYKEAIKAGAPCELSRAQLAATFINQKRWDEAHRELKTLVTLAPERVDIQCNYAITLLRRNQVNDAIIASNKAVELMQYSSPSRNDCANIWLNHGTVLQEAGERALARKAVLKALDLNPDIPNGLTNLGLLDHLDKKLISAKEKYAQSLKQFPNDNLANLNLAGVLLTLGGQYAEKGWEYYEKRLYGPTNIITKPKGNQKIWSGNNLSRALVLVHEQGLGDSFQFIRFAKSLKKLKIECWFQGPTKLHKLFLHSGLVERCLNEEQALPEEVESWCPLLSLPYLIDKQFSPQGPKPADHAYLNAKSGLISKWRSYFGKREKIRVALHWQGNPDHEFALSRGRSLPLKKLETLISVDQIEWVSLQKGPGSEQMNQGAFREKWSACQELISKTWDFENTAAILSNCDLLISSDSGLAHLAGGLGIPVWLLLSWLPEWRWGLEGAHTGWYKNHKIYRQRKENDWNSVTSELKNDLKEFVQQHQGRI